MDKKTKKAIHEAILIVLAAGIVITVAFNFMARIQIQGGEGFTELYFKDHQDLPEYLELNKTYNISFVITNHEQNITTYIYEIQSSVMNLTENVTIYPGGEKRIYLRMTPEEKAWVMEFTTSESYADKLELVNDSKIAEVSGTNLILESGEVQRYLPLSHNVETFGYIYHTNLSKEELEEKPFSKYYKYEDVGVNRSVSREQNTTLFVKGGEVFFDAHSKKSIFTMQREPFRVMLYKYDPEKTDALEIRFWYEFKR